MKKAVFLDRDGVINRERGAHTWQREHFEILPGVPEALKELGEAGWKLVVITNQSGIGLGLYDHVDVSRVHRHMLQEVTRRNASIDAVYYCPHHPRQGKCLCRKPGSLLFERAIATLDIDPASSIMIGDRQRDIDAAAAVGIRGILVGSNAELLPLVRKEILGNE